MREYTQKCYDCGATKNLHLIKRSINVGRYSQYNKMVLSSEVLQSTMVCLGGCNAIAEDKEYIKGISPEESGV